MKITVHNTAKLRRIGVLGQLENASERAELLALLECGVEDVPLQVDFYDIDTLPPEVIASLARCLDRGASLKIFAYHALLTHSLMRLGLPVQQVIGGSIQTPLPACRALALAGSARSLDKILNIVGHLPLGEVAVFVATASIQRYSAYVSPTLESISLAT